MISLKQTAPFNSAAVDCAKLICALLILAIHTAPFRSFSQEGNSVFICLIARLAVPTFFTISGFFFGNKLFRMENQYARWALCGKFIMRTVGIFVLWSILFSAVFLLFEHRLPASNGGIGGLLFPGINPILWFLPALAVAAVFLTLLQYCNYKWMRFLALASFAILVLCDIGVQNIFMGVPLFAFGGIFSLEKRFWNFSQKWKFLLLICCITCDALAWYLSEKYHVALPHFLFTGIGGILCTQIALDFPLTLPVKNTAAIRKLSYYLFVNQGIAFIIFHHTFEKLLSNSLWKYLLILLICIGIALIGMFLSYFRKKLPNLTQFAVGIGK